MLKPLPMREMAARLGRRLTPEEIGSVSEIADYRAMNRLRARVDEIVTDRATAEGLKPWYRWLCKRPCFHDEYLQAFNRPNVRLIDTDGRGVERLTRRGIEAGGEEHKVDCIIFATGFEAGITYSRLTGFEIEGCGGTSLSVHWHEGARTLHGMMTDGFPNCFLMGGNPQTAAAVNAVHLLDEQATHLSYILGQAMQAGATRVEALPEAVDAYVDGIRSSPRNRTQLDFYASCTPGYYNGEGKARRNEDLFSGGRYPEGPMALFEMLAAWREAGTLQGLHLS